MHKLPSFGSPFQRAGDMGNGHSPDNSPRTIHPRTIHPPNQDNSPSHTAKSPTLKLHTYIYTYMHIHIDACRHAYTHTIHTCIHTYIYSCIYIYTYIHSYISTYIDIYIHICLHAYIVYVHTQFRHLASHPSFGWVKIGLEIFLEQQFIHLNPHL